MFYLKVTLHRGGALVIKVALLCVASPTLLIVIGYVKIFNRRANFHCELKYLKYEVEIFKVVIHPLGGRSGLTGVHTHRLKHLNLNACKINLPCN